jgi:hypothetical protein
MVPEVPVTVMVRVPGVVHPAVRRSSQARSASLVFRAMQWIARPSPHLPAGALQISPKDFAMLTTALDSRATLLEHYQDNFRKLYNREYNCDLRCLDCGRGPGRALAGLRASARRCVRFAHGEECEFERPAQERMDGCTGLETRFALYPLNENDRSGRISDSGETFFG